MKKQRLIMIVLGLVIAVGSAYGMYTLTEEFEEKAAVVVATSDIGAYDSFGSENVQIIKIPPKYILPNAVTDISVLIGKEAKKNIYQGEQIIRERMGTESIKPSEKERLLFIPAAKVMLKPGQEVDIYLVYVPGKSEYLGVERIFADKTVASVISESGYSVYDNKGNAAEKNQAGIEVLLTHEEILLYLERTQYSKEVIVRHGEGGEG